MRQIGNIRKAITLAWQTSPDGMASIVLLTAIAALIPPLTIWLSQQLVERVAAAAVRPVPVTAWAPLAVGFGLAFAVQGTLQLIQTNRAQRFAEQVAHLFDHRFLAYAAQADMAYLDDPEWHDRMTRAARSLTSRPVNLVHGLIQLASALITSLGVLGVLFVLHPLLVLIGLVTLLISLPYQQYRTRITYRLFYGITRKERERFYIRTLLSDLRYAQEIRAFGLAPHLLQRYARLVER